MISRAQKGKTRKLKMELHKGYSPVNGKNKLYRCPTGKTVMCGGYQENAARAKTAIEGYAVHSG